MTEPVRRALLSVSDKTGLVAFATKLVSLGIELISTGGTAKALAEAGLVIFAVRAEQGFGILHHFMGGDAKHLAGAFADIGVADVAFWRHDALIDNAGDHRGERSEAVIAGRGCGT